VAWPKLLGGKLTLVHRRWWPALITAARSAAPWQLSGLKPDTKALLQQLKKAGTLRSDAVRLPAGSRKAGALFTELEARLLGYSKQEHTDSGHHARELSTYQLWQREKQISETQLPSLEEALDGLSEATASSVGESALGRLLPWEAALRARPKPGTRVRSRHR
jgi:hypothetical protein